MMRWREGGWEGGREEERGSLGVRRKVLGVPQDESADHSHCGQMVVAPRVKRNY